MKLIKPIVLTLCLLAAVSFDSPKIKEIDKKWYVVGYSESLESPVWIEYKVACTETKFSRKGLEFYTEKGIKTSDSHDYVNNDWDKGHMAPAADFACDSLALIATFSYLNCALQQENLNRGVWRVLEARERSLAAQAEVTVRIDVIVDERCERVASGAAIPRAFKKTILYSGKKEIYYFPNIKPVTSDLESYRANP